MQVKNEKPKKYLYSLPINQHTYFGTFKSDSPLLSPQGHIPREKLIVPQNFGNNSPGEFLVKFIILALSLFFGLVIMAIFLGEVLDEIFK
jgi:hypothetical protein